jgi:hypothetical protein
MTKDFDGLNIEMQLAGKNVRLIYSVSGNDRPVINIEINSIPVEFAREQNPYRLGGASIKINKFRTLLNRAENTIKISL